MISLIIPAYNEEKRILSTLREYYKFFEKRKEDFEILVVANNCTDKTPQIAGNFSASKKRSRLYSIPQKIGKGGAIKIGFEKSNGDWVCFVDADNSTPPAEFGKVLEAAKKHNCVAIASRGIAGSEVSNSPVYRSILGRGFHFLVNLIFGLGIRDTQCGAKVFPAKVAKALIKEGFSSGWEFDVELLLKCRKKNIRIIEIPVIWTEYGDSKLNLLSIPEMFLGLLKMRLSGKL